MSSRHLAFGILLLAWAALAGVSGPALVDHARKAGNSCILQDDARHWVAPFFRYADSELFPNDYIANYHLAASPPGHRAVYRLAAKWVDPAVVSKALPFLQFAVLLAALAWCAWRIGGGACAWATCALALSGYLFFYQMAGGTARSWAFPLTGLTAVLLVAGRAAWLPLLALGAALLYAPISVLLWITALLAQIPQWLRASANAGRFRVMFSAGITLAALALSLAILLATRPDGYGRRLGPADIAAYPEWGAHGRYGFDDRPPYQNVAAGFCDAFGRSLQGDNPAWLPAVRERILAGSVYGRPSMLLILVAGLVGIITVTGSFLLARRDTRARRLCWLLAAAAIAYVAAQSTAPLLYHPHRYVIYAVPVATLILFPAAAAELAGRFLKPPAAVRPLPVFFATVLVLALLGGRGGGADSLSIDTASQRAVYAAVAGLPKTAVVAGWPAGVLDNIPWLARRSVFLNRESHEVLHEAYADEMRRRMNALIDAYFTDHPEPLRRLRDEFGVTHLLLERAHFTEQAPTYFEPFNQRIAQAHARMRETGSEALRQESTAAVYQDDAFILLDLRKL